MFFRRFILSVADDKPNVEILFDYDDKNIYVSFLS